jgi:hypothetical protein
MEVDEMREHYDFSNARPNPYAEKLKNGFSIAIHYESSGDMEHEVAIGTIKNLLKEPGLNSLHLYVKNGENEGHPISDKIAAS